MTARNPQPEERQPTQEPSRINPIAIIAGALASLSAAVVASYFGVAGTLIGTAVVSVVSSLSAALYAGLLGRTRGALQRSTTVLHVISGRVGAPQRPTRSTAPGEAGPTAAEQGAGPAGAPSRGPAEGPATPEARLQRLADLGDEVEGRPAARARPGRPVGWPWRRSVVVVGMAVLIFAIAIGAVTGIEAAIREPIASALGVREHGQARTSVGVAVSRAGGSGNTGRSTPTSSTQPAPSSTPQDQAPSTSEPAPSTTTGGTAPSTTAPPTTAPQGPSTTTGTSGSR